MIPLESFAIVEATAPDVEAASAAITFRMWHLLEAEPARRQLFDAFRFEDRVLGLLDAVIALARRGRGSGGSLRPLIALAPDDEVDVPNLLERALVRALEETLGARATAMVLNAWRDAFRFLMRHVRRA